MTSPVAAAMAAVVGVHIPAVRMPKQAQPAPAEAPHAHPAPGGHAPVNPSKVDFRVALRAQVTAVDVQPAASDATQDSVAAPSSAPAPDSAPGQTGAAAKIHADAQWQRLFPGQTPGTAAAKSVGPVAARPSLPSAQVARLVLVPPPPATAPAAPPAIAAPAVPIPPLPAVAAPSTEADASGASSAPVRNVAAAVPAPNNVPSASIADGTVAADPADDSPIAPAASAQGSTTPSRGASVQSAYEAASADSGPSAAGSQPQPPAPMPALSADSFSLPAGGAAQVQAAAGTPASAPPRQSLAQALGERLQIQITRGSENAVIRLDPPAMGSIEIAIRHEVGAVQVHLSASNGAVLSQLQAIGDALRQDLMQRHPGEVSVQISPGSRDANGRQRQAGGGEDEPGRALHEEADADESTAFTLARNGE
ncbi:MAG: flagellar hook-length control protein FliK [Steroidobacteraceae bacterium]